MTEPIIAILTTGGDTDIITALIDANLRMNPREFSICAAYFKSFASTFLVFMATEVPWVNHWTTKVSFSAKEFWNWKYFPKLFVCIKLRSQCVPLHSPVVGLGCGSYYTHRIISDFHGGGKQKMAGSELYQSCQAPSHHSSSGPRILLQRGSSGLLTPWWVFHQSLVFK